MFIYAVFYLWNIRSGEINEYCKLQLTGEAR